MAPAFEFESFTLVAVYRPRASAGGRREKDMANLKAITEKMFEAVLASSRRTG
jgi:hypothetical protein